MPGTSQMLTVKCLIVERMIRIEHRSFVFQVGQCVVVFSQAPSGRAPLSPSLNLLDWFEGEGEGQGDSARQPVEQTREIPQHRGGRGAKPWAGTLCSLDVKAKALKEEAEGREAGQGQSGVTRKLRATIDWTFTPHHCLSADAQREAWTVATPTWANASLPARAAQGREPTLAQACPV